MVKKTNFLVIGALFVIVPIAVAFSNDGDSEHVESRIQQYMEAWKKNDIEKVWDMMSPDLKQGNNGRFTDFRDFATKQGFHPSDYKIKKITIDKNVATIESEVQYSDFQGNILGIEQEELRFIKIDDVWYFDNYRQIVP